MRNLTALFVSTALLASRPAFADDDVPAKGVRVHLSSDTPGAELQRYSGTGTAETATGSTNVELFVSVCAAPCDLVLDPRRSYRIGGPGLVPSDSFRLNPGATNDLRVSASSRTRRSFGKGLVYLGVPVLVLGLAFYVAGASSEDSVPCAGCVNFHQTGVRWGVGLSLGGVALLASGIALWATSSTTVTINEKDVALRLPGGALSLAPDGLHF